MEVTRLRDGLWRWSSPHPEWEPDQGLSRSVGSVYFEAADAVVLIDPLVPVESEAEFWRALDRDVERLGLPIVVLLTVPWHERSSLRIVERYGARLAEEPPGGVEAILVAGVGGEPETVFWLAAPLALVFGDIVVGSPPRVVDEWQPEERRGEPVRAELQEALLGRPVELLLLAHGDAVVAGAREALAEALR
jgi:hypothetical protein